MHQIDGHAKKNDEKNSEQTVALDDSYREIVRFANRDFQRYALENGVYFAPVDDVSIILAGRVLLTPDLINVASTTTGRDRPPAVHARYFQHDVRQPTDLPAHPEPSKNSRLRLWISSLGNRCSSAVSGV
jgi:hypothetical protein